MGLALVAAALVSCTPSGDGAVAPSASPTSTTSTIGPSATATATAEPPTTAVRWLGRTVIPLGRVRSAGNLRLAGPRVVYTIRYHREDRLYLMNPRTSRTKIIARSEPGGLFDGVTANGRWVVWTEMGIEQSFSLQPTSWTIWRYDVRTGRKSAVQRSEFDTPTPPYPFLHGSEVVWSQPAGLPDKLYDLMLADLRTGEIQRVRHNIGTGRAAFNKHWIFYDRTFQHRTSQHRRLATDLFLLNRDTNETTQVTTSGNAAAPRIVNGSLLWEERRHAHKGAWNFYTRRIGAASTLMLGRALPGWGPVVHGFEVGVGPFGPFLLDVETGERFHSQRERDTLGAAIGSVDANGAAIAWFAGSVRHHFYRLVVDEWPSIVRTAGPIS